MYNIILIILIPQDRVHSTILGHWTLNGFKKRCLPSCYSNAAIEVNLPHQATSAVNKLQYTGDSFRMKPLPHTAVASSRTRRLIFFGSLGVLAIWCLWCFYRIIYGFEWKIPWCHGFSHCNHLIQEQYGLQINRLPSLIAMLLMTSSTCAAGPMWHSPKMPNCVPPQRQLLQEAYVLQTHTQHGPVVQIIICLLTTFTWPLARGYLKNH